VTNGLNQLRLRLNSDHPSNRPAYP